MSSKPEDKKEVMDVQQNSYPVEGNEQGGGRRRNSRRPKRRSKSKKSRK